MYEYPPILSGDALTQIAALRDYLVRRAREGEEESAALAASSGAGAALRTAASAASAAASDGARDRADASLRGLILKTADLTERHVEELRRTLREDYLALSDFGSYREDVETRIVQTARQTVESYDYDERITAAENGVGGLREAVTELNGQIRRGLITDPDTNETVLGIAVSQDLRFTGQTQTCDGLVYWELSPGQTLGIYTSTGWQFWIGGSKRGWFDSADGMLHVNQVLVESRLQLGENWLITGSGGFGLRKLGS